LKKGKVTKKKRDCRGRSKYYLAGKNLVRKGTNQTRRLYCHKVKLTKAREKFDKWGQNSGTKNNPFDLKLTGVLRKRRKAERGYNEISGMWSRLGTRCKV